MAAETWNHEIQLVFGKTFCSQSLMWVSTESTQIPHPATRVYWCCENNTAEDCWNKGRCRESQPGRTRPQLLGFTSFAIHYLIITTLFEVTQQDGRSQWPRGLRRRSTAARLLRSWVRMPPGAWTSVCCDCCVLSGRGLCDELITRPEESYRLWCVVVCDLETSWMRRPWPTGGLSRHKKKNKIRWSKFKVEVAPVHVMKEHGVEEV